MVVKQKADQSQMTEAIEIYNKGSTTVVRIGGEYSEKGFGDF